MATYFTRYYIEFLDNHVVNPATWRVDILDSQGNAPTEPYKLIGAANPLITERINDEDDKFTPIIGKQITISYEYTGNPNEPLPSLFFEADERRFRANVYKNGVLDGVYYIKPDFSEYPDMFPPFTCSLVAVDGFSYLKGTLLNVWDDTGLLDYEKKTLYDIIMTRGLNQIFDAGTVISVMNTLTPNSAPPGYHLLFDTAVHLDIFYDFVEGPASVHDVLLAFCKAFKARIVTDQNQIWFIRVQDLNYSPYTIDRYTDESTVETIELTDFVMELAHNTSGDGIPLGISGNIRMLPAVKEANFAVNYKGINQIENFQWELFDGSDYEGWERPEIVGSQITVSRTGIGTIDDPYKLFIPFPQSSNDIQQESEIGIAKTGDIFDFEMSYRFANVNQFRISISAITDNVGGAAFRLLQDGTWTYGNDPAGLLAVVRSSNKRTGSLKIKSNPIPLQVPGGAAAEDGPFGYRIEIFTPSNPEEREPLEPDGVEIYPLKLGIISISSKGRHLRIRNTANFSRQRDQEQFTFLDTGEDGLSNSLFIGPSFEPEDGGWESPKPGVNPGDIERFMAISVIDQYQRSVNSWEGQVYSNAFNFYNVVTISHILGKVWMMLRDRYNNRTCEHDLTLVEVFAERPTQAPPNELFTISEWDIEEEKD